MHHNYYEDYKYQYQSDRANSKEPQLSELALQGISYCTAVLSIAAATNHSNYTTGGKQPNIGWQGCYAAVNSARAYIMRHEFAEALAHSNPLTTFDLSDVLDNLRADYEDLIFDRDYQLEVYDLATEELKIGVQPAFLNLFPNVAKHSDISNTALTLDKVALAIIRAGVKGGAKATAPTITARNPLYTIIHGMHITDYVARQPFLPSGSVGPGPIERETKFGPNTAFNLILDRNAVNNYPVLRRLQRAGITFVSNFDTYLTYLTDLCRIMEQLFPSDAKDAVQPLADSNLSSRVAVNKISERY